jgi:hypothetical protein
VQNAIAKLQPKRATPFRPTRSSTWSAHFSNSVRFSSSGYDREAGDWLYNALTEHRRLPFRAIIAMENPSSDQAVLLADDLDELQPLMNVPHDCVVSRDAASLSTAMKEMLRFGSRILFVDPFYDPFNGRYKNTFRECLGIIRSLNPDAACEIHYRYHDGKPAPDDLEREATHLFPGGGSRRYEGDCLLLAAEGRRGGFPPRYLLTDRGGIAVDAGFSAEGNHQTTDMHLMSYELSQEKLKAFARGATYYDLVEPVIRVAGSGQVERL